jgi:hypothetical protein
MLDQDKGQNGFYHRQLDFLSLAGSLPGEQRHPDH